MKADEKICTMRILVVDKPGVLVRVVLVFSRRGYNLVSLVVAPVSNPGFSSIVLVYNGKEESARGIQGQLEKLVDVIEVAVSFENR